MKGTYPRYRSNLKYAYGYNTSEAYELEPVGPQTRTVKKKRIRRMRSKAPVIRRVEDNRPKVSVYSAVTMGLIFICALAVSFSFAMNLNKASDIDEANLLLKDMREANAVLEAENSSKFKLADIEKIATTKLGMSKPKAYQIVHITVPKQSYVMQYDSADIDGHDKSFTSKLVDFFASLRIPL